MQVKNFKIGEFSKLARVPVPTLRYYDQVGLLQPLDVDCFTSYRYYSASQLPRLHRILALKGLGFSLEHIATVLAEGLTPEQMRGMFRLRHAQISQQLVEVQSQLVEVEVRLQQIEQEGKLSTYNGYRIVGPDREINIHNTMLIRLDDPSYVTEIQYTVEREV